MLIGTIITYHAADDGFDELIPDLAFSREGNKNESKVTKLLEHR
jgi:hypothetical protein